ncbi:hypothetical protein JCM17960_00510 [Magnetospira thiophila]
MLGLDVGTDSLGWAAFACDPAAEKPMAGGLLAGGVRLFDSGRDPEKQTSWHRERGLKRRARRLPRGKVWRRRELEKLLRQGGIVPPQGPDNSDVHGLRIRALDGPLMETELWRLLAHMSKHRGFMSNRIQQRGGEASASTESDEEEQGAGYWLGAEAVLRQRMADAKVRTVGELLAVDHAAGRPVRMRYGEAFEDQGYAPTRSLLREEFALIRAIQSQRFKALDWDAVEALIFEQRPLRWVDGGHCTFYPEEHRAHRLMPSAQAYLVRQNLANLRTPDGPEGFDRPLNAAEYAVALEYMQSNRRVEWSKLRAALGWRRGTKFTVETAAQGGKRAARGCEGHVTDTLLRPLIPAWPRLTLEDRDRLMEAMLEHRPKRADLIAFLIDPNGHVGVDRNTAEIIADVLQFELPSGRLNLSVRAARDVVAASGPGIPHHVAILNGTGVHHSDQRPKEKLESLPYYASILADTGIGGTGDPAEQDPTRRYGRIGNVSVHIAMNEIAKVVNELLKRYGGRPRLVVVETTRDLKAGAEERGKILSEQRQREKENETIDAELKASGAGELANRREQRIRFRLAKRQRGLCPYSGRPIGAADLLTDAYEVDHIIPLSRGGRDSFNNMVLCTSESNRAKGNQTPREAFGNSPAALQAIEDFLRNLGKLDHKALAWRFGDKAVKLAEDFEEGDGWAPRQETDTSYIAKVARQYLLHVADDVVATKGRLTGWLRRAWDLPKWRGDHRSHFIDAAVIAVTDRGLIRWANSQSARHGSDTLPDPDEVDLPEPFPGYRAQVIRRFDRLWPSLRPMHNRTGEGALHEAMVYGLRREKDGEGAYLVLRHKAATLFTDDAKARKAVEKFASDRMRQRFEKRMDELAQAHPEAGYAELCRLTAADKCWGPRGMTGNSLRGDPVKPGLIALPRGIAKPGGNEVYEVWEVPQRNGKIKWQARVITRHAVATKSADPQPFGPDAKRLMAFSRDDLIYWPDAHPEKVFRVKKMVKNGRIYVWPVRYGTGKKPAPSVQKLFPGINLNGDEGYKFASAEGLRKAKIQPASISILGRLRVKEIT